MRLYHGSNAIVDTPDIRHSREHLDFGRGFYVTSIRDQAERWALRTAAVGGGDPIVNEYVLNGVPNTFRVLEFGEGDDRDWVEFVCSCRRGSNEYRQYDIIHGGVADDKVYRAVDMYFRGYWDIDETLEALKFYEKNDQWCFVSQKAITALLTFAGSYQVMPS